MREQAIYNTTNVYPHPEPIFQPTNTFEVMLSNHVHQRDPRLFFDMFRQREVLLVTQEGSDQGTLALITSPDVSGNNFAYVFTSEESLMFNTEHSELKPQSIARVKGQRALELLAESGLGMNLNAGQEELNLFPPDFVKFVWERFQSKG